MADTCRYYTRSYRAYQTDILNILSKTEILQSKVLLTPTWWENYPNNLQISPCQPYYIIVWPTEIITWWWNKSYPYPILTMGWFSWIITTFIGVTLQDHHIPFLDTSMVFPIYELLLPTHPPWVSTSPVFTCTNSGIFQCKN